MNFYQYSENAIPKQTAYCSDQACPCPGTPIPRGSGFLYISLEAVAFMKAKQSGRADQILTGPMPVLVCEEGARLRGLNLKTAAKDAWRWWETGQVPLRATPKAGMAGARGEAASGFGGRRWLPWVVLAAVLVVAAVAFLLLRDGSEQDIRGGQVRGMLLDAGTGQPMEGARCEINVGGSTGEGEFTLRIGGDSPEATTDSSGEFFFETVAPESYFLTCFTDPGMVEFADRESYFFEIAEGQVLDLGTISGRAKAEAQAQAPSPVPTTESGSPPAVGPTPVPEPSRTPVQLPTLASGPPISSANAHTVHLLAALEQAPIGIVRLAFSQDGAFLASSPGCVWDASTGGLIAERATENTEVAWSPTTNLLAHSDRRDVIRLWDAATERELAQLEGHSDTVDLLAWSPDGTLLASSSDDGTIRLWEVEAGQEVAVLELADTPRFRSVHSFSWSPDSGLVSVAVTGGAVLMVDRAGNLLRQLPLENQWDLAWSPDGTVLACRGKAVTNIWDASDEEFTHQLPSGPLAWSPDGKRLAIGDLPIVIWDKQHETEVAMTTPGSRSNSTTVMALSPDGMVLASGLHLEEEIRLWDTQTGQELAVLKVPSGDLEALAWRPDGTQLASCCSFDETSPQTVRLWHAIEGSPVSEGVPDTPLPTASPQAGSGQELTPEELASAGTHVYSEECTVLADGCGCSDEDEDVPTTFVFLEGGMEANGTYHERVGPNTYQLSGEGPTVTLVFTEHGHMVQLELEGQTCLELVFTRQD